MRPVERGPLPLVNGVPKVVRDYGEFRDNLAESLGLYCSYCEAPIAAKLEVEHIAPKALHPADRNDWNNLLLVCGFCNPEKGVRDIDRATNTDFVWPDRDNTFRAFCYGEGGTVSPASLDRAHQDRALRTRDLVGLNGPHLLKPTDARKRRWTVRRQSWERIREAQNDLRENDTPAMRRQILTHAKTMGFWSMWMTVFSDDRAMLAALMSLIPGTALSCFDATHQPIQRPGGLL